MTRYQSLFSLLISLPLLSQQYYPSMIMGEEGHREYSIWQGSSSAVEGILRPDGNLLLAGTGYWNGCNCFRMTLAVIDTTCGALDATFGNNGTTSVQFEGRSTFHDMTLLPDERIVACGVTAPGNGFSGHKPAVYRLMSDGSPDTTFNGTGYRKESFDPISSGAFWQTFTLPDGRITCVGSSTSNINGGVNSIGAMRFNPDGNMDNTFSGDGKATLNLASTGFGFDYDLGTGVMLADGSAIAIGLFTNAGNQFIGMVRFDSTGTVDMSFGTNGLNVSSVEAASDVSSGGMNAVLTSNGKILVAGTGDFTAGEFFVARFDTNGDLDPSYGTNGVSTVAIASNALGRRLELLPDGSSLQYGSSNWNNGGARIVKRLSDGSLDTTFGNNGIATPSSPLFKKLYGGLSLPNNRILAWGVGSDISLFKFLTTPDSENVIDLGADFNACSGDSVSIDAGAGYSTLVWSTGDSTQSITTQTSGDYSVVVSDLEECHGTDTVHVEFHPGPTQPIITVNNNVELSTSAIGTLQWFLDGNIIPGANQNMYTATSNGDYTVSVTDTIGCSSTSAIIQVTNVGINESYLPSISLYPNPATDMIFVKSSGNVKHAWLIDITGQTFLPNWASPNTMDVSMIAKGSYRLLLLDENGNRSVLQLAIH